MDHRVMIANMGECLDLAGDIIATQRRVLELTKIANAHRQDVDQSQYLRWSLEAERLDSLVKLQRDVLGRARRALREMRVSQYIQEPETLPPYTSIALGAVPPGST